MTVTVTSGAQKTSTQWKTLKTINSNTKTSTSTSKSLHWKTKPLVITSIRSKR